MELMDLIRTNRTYRRFKQTAVSDEIIAEVLEAARNAASALTGSRSAMLL
ncbi:MAG: nitroreductase family protein [Lachnospiraceae bacterium]|jgi:hypothetical protein